jgi:phosphatidylserine decarboxylase
MVVRDGYLFIAVPLVLSLILLALGLWYLSIALFILAAFMAYFFRDPRRVPPEDQSLIVSPADGRVTLVSKVDKDDPNSPSTVSIFLSPFDVHINRAPVSGVITDITYHSGRFRMATREDASIVNEQNVITIKGDRITVVCRQIAGILARRIVCWKKVGERVELGERFGLIKFSSRTDLLMPPEVEVLVRPGDRVKGGISIIGRIKDA